MALSGLNKTLILSSDFMNFGYDANGRPIRIVNERYCEECNALHYISLSDGNTLQSSCSCLFPKTFVIVYWNHNAQQIQTRQVTAKNSFRAGRFFYRSYSRRFKIKIIHEVI